MARIGHIAIRSRDSRQAADFFKQAFGLREVGAPVQAMPGSPPAAVGLTDGRINLTFLTVPADMVGCDEDFYGIQHIGFVVDHIDAHSRNLEGLGAPCIIGWDKLPPGAHLEIKFKGPDDVIFDISPSPWPGTPGTHRTGTLQSGDVKLFYRHFRGPGLPDRAPVMIFHGANYYDSTDWIDVAAGLAADRDVLVWDARGFGQSSWSPCKNYSIDAHLDDANALIEHFNWQRTIVVGHSLGGLYALLFASKFHLRTAGLVLVDTSLSAAERAWAHDDNVGARQKGYASVEEALRDTSREAAPLGSAMFESFASRMKPADGGYMLLRDPEFANRVPRDRHDWQSRYPVGSVWQELQTVSSPALVVRALRSDRLQSETVERLARDYPSVEVTGVDAGHDLPGAAPDGLVNAIRGFLTARDI